MTITSPHLPPRYAPSTQGQLRTQLQTPSFRITEAHYLPNITFAAHAHEHRSITAVLDGGFAECFRGENQSCARQSVLIKPAAHVHSNIYGEMPTRCLLIAVTQPLGAADRIFDRVSHLKGGPPYALLLAVRQELETADDLAPAAAEGLLLELLVKVGRDTALVGRSAPLWVKSLRRTLRERCREQVTMNDVGVITGVHPVYAARVFKQCYGLAPIAFVRRCRIDWAISTLLETSIPISAIAIAAGFSDQSHFTRAFTRLTGRTPSSVRESGRR